MTIPTDSLNEEYTIETPENVSIGYTVAGIGNRFIAALIDSALLGLALIVSQILLIISLALSGNPIAFLDQNAADWRQGLALALYALVTFGLFWGYFILFEWLWRGQTPGKRITHIRVVRLDGSPPRFLDIAVRNLVRIIDFFPFGYGVGLITMFFNRQTRRLGDLAAGVIVVKDRSELRLEHVAVPTLTAPVSSSSPAADRSMPASQTASHAPTGLPAAVNPIPDEAPAIAPASPATLTTPESTLRAQALLANRFPTLRRLRVADFELMQESLRRYDAGTLDRTLLIRLVQVMAQKAGEPEDVAARLNTGADARIYLLEIMDAYRQTQAS